MQGRSFKRLAVWAVEKELEGVYLSETMNCLDEECFIVEKKVNVVMGAFDIFVEQRGAWEVLKMEEGLEFESLGPTSQQCLGKSDK